MLLDLFIFQIVLLIKNILKDNVNNTKIVFDISNAYTFMNNQYK